MVNRKLINRLVRVSRELKDLPRSSQKHFTFIVKRNKIVSLGHNDGWKTSPLAHKFGHRFNSTHSELSALTRFPYRVADLKDFTFINIRLGAYLDVRNSKPCKACQKLLDTFGVQDVWYSTNDGKFLKLER